MGWTQWDVKIIWNKYIKITWIRIQKKICSHAPGHALDISYMTRASVCPWRFFACFCNNATNHKLHNTRRIQKLHGYKPYTILVWSWSVKWKTSLAHGREVWCPLARHDKPFLLTALLHALWVITAAVSTISDHILHHSPGAVSIRDHLIPSIGVNISNIRTFRGWTESLNLWRHLFTTVRGAC